MTDTCIYEVLARATAVCFDVDSTLIRLEGIDRLAKVCGVGEEVEKITKTAMSGNMNFKEALGMRLNIIKPTLNKVKQLVEEDLSDIDNVLTPHVKELVDLLHSRGISVYVISGGFRRLIEPITNNLRIEKKNLYCNALLFNEAGEYEGFDLDQLTCQDGGKSLVMRDIKKKHEYVVMIGDGMTDLQASPPADAFIGFGGNVVRSRVKELSNWYVHDMQELIEAIELQRRTQTYSDSDEESHSPSSTSSASNLDDTQQKRLLAECD
ncbi:PREDICTED: phosphoserine phosphatase-like [Amphimedon queenslandica]|uniref:Phosphoserine phosphatase n=1 Tax=Amphimedon queenslandica TaxID=400682 RepID=A0A1X7URI6_AMPQE|nr:PREDICTED: phosphoserine phosphatase-like [Amphimedon queenslandica]|eukprot:XP_003386961.1 PREDICTED: phosphoserine phosphatase-like [Amphimedon queenslandica]